MHEVPAPKARRKGDPDTEEWGDPPTSGEPAAFSETAWFMAAVKPETLQEKAGADDLEGKYQRDESLSEEERQKYSLNRKKPGKGGKKS